MQGAAGKYSVEFGRLSADEWTEVLTAFDDAVIYQTYQYGVERWGEGSLGHVVVRSGGVPVAAAQTAEIGVPRIGVGVSYVPWGPLFRPRGRGVDHEALGRLLDVMRERYSTERGLCLRMTPRVAEGGDGAVARALAAAGFRRVPSAPPHRTLMMDLSLPLEEIRRGLRRTYAQHYRRALKNAVDVAEGTAPEFYRQFLDLYGEMKARKSFACPVDARAFGRMQDSLPEALKMHITVCSRERRPVSALVTSEIGETAVGIFAASNGEGRDTCAAYLMWWQAVDRIKADGRRWLDLGGFDPETAPGPARFKTHLAGKAGKDVRFIGQFEAAGGFASRICVGAACRLRDASRRLASAARAWLGAAARAPVPADGREEER